MTSDTSSHASNKKKETAPLTKSKTIENENAKSKDNKIKEEVPKEAPSSKNIFKVKTNGI